MCEALWSRGVEGGWGESGGRNECRRAQKKTELPSSSASSVTRPSSILSFAFAADRDTRSWTCDLSVGAALRHRSMQETPKKKRNCRRPLSPLSSLDAQAAEGRGGRGALQESTGQLRARSRKDKERTARMRSRKDALERLETAKKVSAWSRPQTSNRLTSLSLPSPTEHVRPPEHLPTRSLDPHRRRRRTPRIALPRLPLPLLRLLLLRLQRRPLRRPNRIEQPHHTPLRQLPQPLLDRKSVV